MKKNKEVVDVCVIGGGPAGLTSSIYCLRSGLKVTMFEKAGIGGQAALTDNIENYPSYSSINGFDLTYKMLEQAMALGLNVVYEEALLVEPQKDKTKKIVTQNGTYYCKSVILCMGATAKKLGIEDNYLGRGVSYCATCDGNFFKNKVVAINGGGDSAVTEALYLSNIASKVYIIHRRGEFRAKQVVVDRLLNKVNITPVYNSVIESLFGEDKLKGLKIKNVVTNELSTLEVEGLFVAIGQAPQSLCVSNLVRLENGFIKSDEKMQTNRKGIFVAGDIRQKTLRQVVTACSDGAIAAEEAGEYISTNF